MMLNDLILTAPAGTLFPADLNATVVWYRMHERSEQWIAVSTVEEPVTVFEGVHKEAGTAPFKSVEIRSTTRILVAGRPPQAQPENAPEKDAASKAGASADEPGAEQDGLSEDLYKVVESYGDFLRRLGVNLAERVSFLN